MKGQHKPGYVPPRTGEKRKVRQPLIIDGLGQPVRDAIRQARAEGKTWEHTAALASLLAGRSLAASVVHRWFYLQLIDDSFEQRRRLQAWKETLDDRSFTENPEGSQRILAGELSEIMANGTNGERVEAMKILFDSDLKLAKLKIDHEKVEIDKRAQGLAEKKLEQAKEKTDRATNDAATKIGKGGKLTIDDINRIRERAFGLPPVKREAASSSAA